MTEDNYRAWKIEPLKNSEINEEELFKHLVGWAILAPNSHNVQPWRFIIKPTQHCIEVCVDPPGILPASDMSGREAFISIGCAIENLLLASDCYGLRYTLEISVDKKTYPEFSARVVFNTAQTPKSAGEEYLMAMKSRKMNRGKFNPSKSLPQELVSKMQAVVQERGMQLHIITDALTRFAISELQYTADHYVIATDSFRKELADFFLPNNTLSGRGMPGNTFGLNDESAQRVHEELKKDGIFDPDLAAGMAASNRDAIKSSPVIGIIGVPDDVPEWWLRAGMVFNRIALLAEMNGCGVAVHAALVEVEMFNKLLKMRLLTRQRPTVIFRMGYAVENRPHAPRLNVEDVTEIIY